MLAIGVGCVSEDDHFKAAASAVMQARQALGTHEPNVVLLFTTSKYDATRVLAGARESAGGALIVGATTAGEISTEGSAIQPSVVAMAITSDTIRFAAASATGLKADSHEAGRKAAEIIKAALPEDMKLVTMLSDGLSGNGSSVIRGILEVLGEHFPLTGGSAGDDGAYKQTFQFLNDQVLTDSVVALGWAGKLEFGVGVRHGWVPVGTPMKATKTEGAIVHELDDKPAIAIYEDYFGPEKATELRNKTLASLALSYPLGIKDVASDEMTLRAPFFVTDTGSIVCGGEVPQGSEVYLMVGGRIEAIAAAKTAAEHAMAQLKNKVPTAAIIFSCHVRDKLFGNRERAQHEIDAIKAVIGSDVPIAGFYTYAEQAPINGEVKDIKNCNPTFHNETIVITLISEAE